MPRWTVVDLRSLKREPANGDESGFVVFWFETKKSLAPKLSVFMQSGLFLQTESAGINAKAKAFQGIEK